MRDFTWRVSDCEELVGEFKEMIMYYGNVLILIYIKYREMKPSFFPNYYILTQNIPQKDKPLRHKLT